MAKGKFMAGALIGATLGAIGGLLFAPQKGSETRKELKTKANKYGKQLKKELDDRTKTLRDEGVKFSQEVKKTGMDIAQEVQTKTTDMLEKVGVSLENENTEAKSDNNKRRYFKGTK